MIIGAADREATADAELRQNRRCNRLIFRRIFDRSGRNDH